MKILQANILTLLLLSTTSQGSPPMTNFLKQPGGKIAWSLHGETGPLVIAMPGMGDLRANMESFADTLASRGYRVATLDLRGHGESDTGFADVSAQAIADDALALAAHLDSTPAVFLGSSYTGATAVWVASLHPDRVKAIVLVDPFVREIPPTFLQKLTMAVGLVRPWGPSLWGSYYRSLFKDRAPKDLDARVERVVSNLKEKGRFEALKAMTRTSTAECEAKLGSIAVPALIVMGSKDPDFEDPAAEARLVGERLHGGFAMIDGAGHYPHVEDPGEVADRVDRFVSGLKGARP